MEAPHQKKQRVIFIRHGIALHNILDPQGSLEGGGSNRRHDLFDPPLTTDGKMQAVLVGDTIRRWIREQRTTTTPHFMVMTSPLTRCLQTAMYAFGIPSEYPICPTTFQCHENLREACGKHRCDARRTKSELQQCWNSSTNHNCRVQFSPTMTERDELWSAEHRETIADLQRRIQDFMSFLITVQKPVASTMVDSNIHPSDHVVFIVVTHGVWIETLLRVHQAPYNLLYTTVVPHPAGANAATPPVTAPKRVYNGDAYYCECISSFSSNHQLQLERIQNFHQICGHGATP